MKLSLQALLLGTLMMIVAGGSAAQVNPGIPPFESFARGPIDDVNLSTLNTHVTIPILHKSGRGLPIDVALMYDNALWSSGSKWGPRTLPSQWFGWY